MTAAVDDVTAQLGAVQARLAGLTPGPGGRPPEVVQSQFSSVLARLVGTGAVGGTTGGVLGASDASSAATATVTGDQVVADASQYIGVPYVWGGTDPSHGLDCSGLVQRTYADLGITLPRVAADQARMGTAVPDLAHARPGDLVAFGSPVDHIGIYAGDGKMVVAPHRGTTVRIEDITGQPTAIRRILPEGSAVGSLLAPNASSVSGPYAALFSAAGAKYGVDPKLLSAVAKAESGYRPDAVSGAGAEGLMQLMPQTAASLGVDPMDPGQAIDGAARLLAGHLQRFGQVDLALAAYNAGGSAVAHYGGIPPYPETQAYVQKVLAYAQEMA